MSLNVTDDYEKFLNLYPKGTYITNVVFDDGSKYSAKREPGDIGIDQIYATQHQFALRWFIEILKNNPEGFAGNDRQDHYDAIDIGSQFEFVINMAAFANFIIADPSLNLGKFKAVTSPDLGAMFTPLEAQNLEMKGKLCINLPMLLLNIQTLNW